MTTVAIENKVGIDIKTYYIKYFNKKSKKEEIRNKLENIANKYYKKNKPLKNISEIDKLLYL